ncbi:MAG: C25 family cysteine peptidase, partial [Pseudomonadota bacterium]
MKKILFLACSILAVVLIKDYAHGNTAPEVKNSANGVSFDVKIESFELVNVGSTAYKKVIADGLAMIDSSCSPGVLRKSMLIEIPPACDITVSASSGEPVTYKNFYLAPVPKKVIIENEGVQKLSEEFEIDQGAYRADGLFPGKLAEIEFIGYLRGKRVASIIVYPVQYNPAKQELTVHKQMSVSVAYNYAVKAERVFPEPLRTYHKSDSLFEKIYTASILNYSQSAEYSQDSPEQKNVPAPIASWYTDIKASPFSVKALIENEGMYKITYEDLQALGVSLASATNENLQMTSQGKELAIYCSGTGLFKPGDYIVFYGTPFKSLYSKKNVYWIYQGKQSGKRMKTINGSPDSSYPLQNAFKAMLHAEKDLIYWSNIPPYSEGIDHYLWEKLSIIDPPLSKDFTISLGHINQASGNFSLKTCLVGQTGISKNPDHHTKIYINDTEVDDFTWDGQTEKVQDTQSIAPAAFKDGDNKITLEAVADLGVTVDSYYLNWFELSCWSKYSADHNALKFHNTATSGVQFSLDGFTESSLWCFDVTDPANASRIANARIAQSGGAYTMNFEDTATDSKTYFALGVSAFASPSDLSADEASNLNSPRESVDYIIITHDTFYDGIQELKSYRESKGLGVEVVKIQDVYDEFSYGIKDVKAIKDFLSYAYSNWKKNDHPAYVLLVGDASTDYRDDLGNYAQGNEDFIPTFLYETNPFGNTPTDNWFVCVDGADYLPDMIIGRISVKTVDDLQNVISKIKKYENSETAAWCGNVILAADNETMFESLSNNLAAMLPEGFNAVKVYISAYAKIQSATDDLIKKINAGAVITNYSGHGNVSEWSKGYLLHTTEVDNTRNDVDKLSNGDALTFLMTLDCLNGYFPHHRERYSLAEEFVR